MIPIEDAVERAERRDRELARAQADSSERLSRYRRTLHWIQLVHDTIERAAYVAFGYAFATDPEPNRWHGLAVVLIVVKIAIDVTPLQKWKNAVSDEEARRIGLQKVGR